MRDMPSWDVVLNSEDCYGNEFQTSVMRVPGGSLYRETVQRIVRTDGGRLVPPAPSLSLMFVPDEQASEQCCVPNIEHEYGNDRECYLNCTKHKVEPENG